MNAYDDSVRGRLAGRGATQRTPSAKLELFRRPDFLSADLCAQLMSLVDRDRRPSTIADHNGDESFRTSETCDLSPGEPAVHEVEAALHELANIDPAYGEPLQGQRYAVGQEFKPHTDYFTPNGADYKKYCAVAGQRTWTFMIYLNAPAAGGGTRFKAIDKIVKPQTGMLLCWNNRWPDGSINPNTLHHGMKVRRGTKYVLTKWYREKEWR